MARSDEKSTLLVEFERTGRRLTKVKDWSIASDYVTSTDGFKFTAYSDDVTEIEDLELEPVKLSVHGAPQLVGRIDGSEAGNDGSAISYSGRDYLADFVEDNIDTRLIFAEGQKLGDVILRALEPHGVTSIDDSLGVNTRDVRTGIGVGGSPAKDFKNLTVEDLKPDTGGGTFDFINRLLARFHATLQPHPSDRAKVLITAPNYTGTPVFSATRRKRQSGSNNVIEGVRVRDLGNVPSVVWFDGDQARSGEDSVSLLRRIDTASSARPISPTLADLFENKLMRGLHKDRDMRRDAGNFTGFLGTETRKRKPHNSWRHRHSGPFMSA